jgi:hypothetical protein
LIVTDVVLAEYSAGLSRFRDPGPVVPRCRKYPFAPDAAAQVNVTLGPANVLPCVGEVSVVGVLPDEVKVTVTMLEVEEG